MSAIHTRRLVKRFDATVAVNEVDLMLEAGEVRGLLGPNGAGKTTLLRMLLGLIRPDAGEIELLGQPLEGSGSVALHGVGGFVEDPAFYPYLSGRVNLRLLARLDGAGRVDGSDRGLEAAIDAALTRVGLEQRGDHRVGGYSTGMRQRLGIAAALLRSPRLLLLDEPTSGLDPAGARAVATLVRELAADGVAVLLSSHQIGELERICTGFSFLREGRVVWDGTAAELEAQAPASAFELATSDDAAALRIAAEHDGLRAQLAMRGGIVLTVRPGVLDGFVLALGDARIAVRRLELRVSPLESMFFALMSDEPRLDELEPDEFAARVLASR
ncbi:MAG TPA: ABC transporter ATP-binding protein [Solirubrobacteraceae bacterium]|nr:ABC transporter ATP-binding protein [Solirubrobacteraceae bacterium]